MDRGLLGGIVAGAMLRQGDHVKFRVKRAAQMHAFVTIHDTCVTQATRKNGGLCARVLVCACFCVQLSDPSKA